MSKCLNEAESLPCIDRCEKITEDGMKDLDQTLDVLPSYIKISTTNN